MELDRQSVERRDFPISRRGYDPAAVDAHLRSLAAEMQELERSLHTRHSGGRESLGAEAAIHVQSVLEAAEASAADIERHATLQATATLEEADSDAQSTREEARQHVQAVSRATATLLEKVESMDREVGALLQSLRSGAGRLAADLRALEANMGELYDTARGAGTGAVGSTEELEVVRVQPTPMQPTPAPPAQPAGATDTGAVVAAGYADITAPAPPTNGFEPVPAATPAPTATPTEAPFPPDNGEDLDGARLIALNMALNGEPREQADRYLAEHFALSDREKLLDEVYAAIEG